MGAAIHSDPERCPAMLTGHLEMWPAHHHTAAPSCFFPVQSAQASLTSPQHQIYRLVHHRADQLYCSGLHQSPPLPPSRCFSVEAKSMPPIFLPTPSSVQWVHFKSSCRLILSDLFDFSNEITIIAPLCDSVIMPECLNILVFRTIKMKLCLENAGWRVLIFLVLGNCTREIQISPGLAAYGLDACGPCEQKPKQLMKASGRPYVDSNSRCQMEDGI